MRLNYFPRVTILLARGFLSSRMPLPRNCTAGHGAPASLLPSPPPHLLHSRPRSGIHPLPGGGEAGPLPRAVGPLVLRPSKCERWGDPHIFSPSHNSTASRRPSLSFRTAVRNLGRGGAGLPTSTSPFTDHPFPIPKPREESPTPPSLNPPLPRPRTPIPGIPPW